MNNSDEIILLDVLDVANFLHVNVKTIYNLIYSKKKGKAGISQEFYIKVGKKLLFIKSKVNTGILAGNFIS